MPDSWGDVLKGVGVVLIVVALGWLVGSCVQDYRTATLQTLDAIITGGSYKPGHYDTTCTSDGKGQTRCDTDWIAPRWTLQYHDEAGTHWEDVDEKVYSSLQAGDRVYVRFWQGGRWGIRYHVQFSTERPAAVEAGS